MKVAAALSLACALPVTGFALGIRIADQDARATARGNAFTATADNPSAIYYNPAGITQLYQSSLNRPSSLSLASDGKSKTVLPPEPADDSGLRARLGVYSITLETKVKITVLICCSCIFGISFSNCC